MGIKSFIRMGMGSRGSARRSGVMTIRMGADQLRAQLRRKSCNSKGKMTRKARFRQVTARLTHGGRGDRARCWHALDGAHRCVVEMMTQAIGGAVHHKNGAVVHTCCLK